MVPIILLVAFWAVGVLFWQLKDMPFFLYNFGIIGTFLFGLGFLVLILVTLIVQGGSAFTQTMLDLPVRYDADSIHYVTPTDDNQRQCESMQRLGVFSSVTDEVGEIIVADLDQAGVGRLIADDGAGLDDLIAKR